MNLEELRRHIEDQKRLDKATVTLSIEDAEELLRMAERPVLHQSQGFPGMVVVDLAAKYDFTVGRSIVIDRSNDDAQDALAWHMTPGKPA